MAVRGAVNCFPKLVESNITVSANQPCEV